MNSYAHASLIMCPKCGHRHQQNIWMIVDDKERPDLMDRIRKNSIHTLECPKCNSKWSVEAPLLVYRPNSIYKLLFDLNAGSQNENSPQQATGYQKEVDSELAMETKQASGNPPIEIEPLLFRLQNNLGSAWRPEFVNNILSVSREMLVADDDEIQQTYLASLTNERFTQAAVVSWSPDVSENIQKILMAFLGAPSWEKTQEILESYPELFSSDAAKGITGLIENARSEGYHVVLENLVEHKLLLERCTSIGIKKAFEEKFGKIGPDRESNLEPDYSHPNLLPQREESIKLLGPRIQFEVDLESLPKKVKKVLEQFHPGDAVTNRIRLLRSGIQNSDRGVNPDLVAWFHFMLGNTFLETQNGAAEAIKAYREALSIWKRETSPNAWAQVMCNLANAYTNLPSEQDTNIEKSIDIYLGVLEVWTPEKEALSWSIAMFNLGNSYMQRTKDTAESNINMAIECYKQALKTKLLFHGHPETWTKAVENLALAYLKAPRDFVRLRNAINCYENLIEYYRSQGISHEELRIKETFESCKQRLAFLQNPEKPSYVWKSPTKKEEEELRLAVQNRFSLNEIPPEKRAVKIIEALISNQPMMFWDGDIDNVLFDQLSRMKSEIVDDQDHLDKLNNLQRKLSSYLLKEDSFEAIINTARTYNDPEKNEQEVRKLLSASQKYRDLQVGDRSYNLERYYRLAEKALQLVSSRENPELWAEAATNLGTSFSERIVGSAINNKLQAIKLYKEAYKGLHSDGKQKLSATIIMNLANTYRDILPTTKKDLIRSIKLYKKSLKRIRKNDEPLIYAKILLNLSKAYGLLLSSGDSEKLELVIQNCNEGLSLLTSKENPNEWASLNFNKGQAYNLKNNDCLENVTNAIESFQNCLSIWTPQLYPENCRNTAYELGKLFFKKSEWDKALSSLKSAVEAGEILFNRANSPKMQTIEIVKNTNFYCFLVSVCSRLNKNHAREAFLYAEAAKARQFLLQFSTIDVPYPERVPRVFVEREKDLSAQLRNQYHSFSFLQPTDSGPAYAANHYESLRLELENLREDISIRYPETKQYSEYRSTNLLRWEEAIGLMSLLGPDTAVVEYSINGDEIVIIVLKEGFEQPHIEFTRIPAQELKYRYLLPFKDMVSRNSSNVGIQSSQAWQALGEILLQPIRACLEDSELVYFIPHGWIHQIPLHALLVNKEPFICQHTVVYAPSVAILLRILKRKKMRKSASTKASVIAYTPDKEPKEKELFLGEARSVGDFFGVQPLLGKQATAQALSKEARDSKYIHISCHANFTVEDAYGSSLVLADSKFTVRDWMKLRLEADLVSLSACETGVLEQRAADELAGFGRAVLYSGAESALLTLWRVDAETTGIWMKDFYEGIIYNDAKKSSKQKSLAFQKATLNLMEKYDDPFYWSPFILLGA